MTTKLTNDVMRWVDDQLARDPELRERVEQRMAELHLEEELVALREARGLTQGQVAKLLGISQPAVAKIEAGRQRNIGLRTLMNFITALGGELQVRVKAQPAKVIGLRPASSVSYHSARTGTLITATRHAAENAKRGESITVSRVKDSSSRAAMRGHPSTTVIGQVQLPGKGKK